MVWEVKKLSEICDNIFAGGDAPKNNLSKFKTDKYSIPIYANGKKNKGLYGYTDVAKVTTPSMTVSARGTIGYSEIRNEPFYPVVRLIVLTPNTKIVQLEYLKYLLEGMDFKNSGTSIPQLTVPMVKNYQCELPSINEQKRIVAILELAFAEIEKVRANAEQNLKNARELFESYLQQVFSQRGGWVEKELGGVCDFLNGYAFKSRDSIDYSDTQLIRMGNLYQNTLSLDRKPVFYPSNHANEYKKFSLVEGDLVMSLTGTVGKKDYGFTVEIPRFSGNLLLNQRIVKFIDIDKSIIGKSFLLRILRSGFFLDKLYESANGTRQANLSTVTMKKLKILLPKLSVQEELIITFDKLELEIERLEKNYKTKIASLDELKKSILQKAFTGELTKKAAT